MQQADQIGDGGDGLDELDKRRQRRRPLAPRNPRVPPPPAPSEPVVNITITEPAESGGERVQPDTPAAVALPPSEPPPRASASRGVSSGGVKQVAKRLEEAVEPLRLAQFYVTPEIDKFLRAVRAEALTQDLDVTASAVARMALQRLADETTPQELVRQLSEPKKGKTRGRPRR